MKQWRIVSHISIKTIKIIMKNIQKLAFLFTFLMISFTGFAQGGKIVFEKTTHNFGSIQEKDGPVTATFEFTNTGTSPIKLTDVKASCGCTTPEWTKEAIPAGKTGFVTASYNPQNRPGSFDKTVTVHTDGEPKEIFLKINGNVIPREKGVEDWYPVSMGNLRVTTKSVYFQKVYHDQTNAQESITLYNSGTKPMGIKMETIKSKLPAHVMVSIGNPNLQPKDSTKLTVTYNAVKKNDWGYVYDPFTLYTDDDSIPNKEMYVTANILENFGNITSSTPLPMIKLDKTTHDFGKVYQNTQNKAVFTITNQGNAPLIIRKTKASCGCTASQPKKTTLAAGESTVIDITYSSGTQQGKQTKTVTVICNDPATSELRLNISADVLEGTEKNE
jgi:hypothetical protein